MLPSEAVFHMICHNMRTHPPPTQSHAAPTAEIQEMLLLFHLSTGWSLTPIEDQIQTSLTVHSGGPVFPFPGLQPQTNILHHIKACSRISWSVRYFRLRGHTVCFYSTAGLFVVNCFHFHIPVYFFSFSFLTRHNNNLHAPSLVFSGRHSKEPVPQLSLPINQVAITGGKVKQTVVPSEKRESDSSWRDGMG